MCEVNPAHAWPSRCLARHADPAGPCPLLMAGHWSRRLPIVRLRRTVRRRARCPAAGVTVGTESGLSHAPSSGYVCYIATLPRTACSFFLFFFVFSSSFFSLSLFFFFFYSFFVFCLFVLFVLFSLFFFFFLFFFFLFFFFFFFSFFFSFLR